MGKDRISSCLLSLDMYCIVFSGVVSLFPFESIQEKRENKT